MKVVIVNGQGGVGKTSFEGLCLESLGIYGTKTSMVDFVKEVATFSGWRGDKDEKARLYLAKLKDIMEEFGDIPWLRVNRDIKTFENDLLNCGFDANRAVIFVDAREPKDIQRFKDEYGAISVLVTRGEEKVYGNHADDGVFNIEYDCVIENNGTWHDLELAAERFLEWLFEERE
jgi:hypothetical protein